MYLGIDIGTSKTAAVITSAEGAAAAAATRDHRSRPAPEGHAEQDCGLLLDAAVEAVRSLPAEARAAVRAVGLTGQMHGVLLLDRRGEPVSPLVTWQDTRCRDWRPLRDLASRTGHELRSGYGCATLAWLAAHAELPPEAEVAATIQDWVAAVLCGRERPVTDPTDAASWGLFDLSSLAWDLEAARAAGFPEGLLPEVVPCGATVGATSPEASVRFGIPAGIPVAAALGDNQASLLATLREPDKELALTLGTGGQLSAVQPRGSEAAGPWTPAGSTWEYRPYPGGRLLAVAAGLCGGSAWRWLEETARGWMRDLTGQEPSADDVYARLNELGAGAVPPGLAVRPHFLGERFAPALRGTITGIDLDNFRLGSLAGALAEGICRNLLDMLPAELRRGRARVVASGNALERNPLLRAAAERVFGLPLVVGEVREAAAVGSALNAARAQPNT